MPVGAGPGTGVTRIGHRGFFMAGSHIAHDCVVGDDVIFADTPRLIGGHVTVGDARAFLSGNSAVHQFCRVGRLAFLSRRVGVEQGHSAVLRDAGRELRSRIEPRGDEARRYPTRGARRDPQGVPHHLPDAPGAPALMTAAKQRLNRGRTRSRSPRPFASWSISISHGQAAASCGRAPAHRWRAKTTKFRGGIIFSARAGAGRDMIGACEPSPRSVAN